MRAILLVVGFLLASLASCGAWVCYEIEAKEEETMGNFRLEAEWVGGHGCQREKKSGELVEGCGEPHCPDCKIRKFVAEMNASCSPVSAILRHWPGTPGEVFDNLNTKQRKGNF